MHLKLLVLLVTVRYEYISAYMDADTLDLVTPRKELGEFCGYQSCPTIKEGVLNVHIVAHSHTEYGVFATFDEHYSAMVKTPSDYGTVKRILDYTITQLWENDKRKFTIDNMAYFFHWWARRDETVHRMVYELVRQGRLSFLGGGWSMPDEATTSYHAIIDQFTHSLRKINSTFLNCGRPLVSWQSEVQGHSREMASLMALMGFDGQFISPISFDDELRRMKRQALEFMWRGSDDLGSQTDAFTHVLFDGIHSPPGFCFSSLCTDPYVTRAQSFISNTEERAKAFMESMLYRQHPYYNTSNVMVIMGGTYAYYDAPMWFENIERLMDAVNSQFPNKLNVFYSTPYCYLMQVYNENPALETKQDDFFPLSWNLESYATGFYTSRPSFKLLAREGHLFLYMSQQLQVLARLPDNGKKIEELMWIHGLFQDHSLLTGQMHERVSRYYISKMSLAIQKSTLVLKQAFNQLRSSPAETIYFRCAFNISRCYNLEGSSAVIVVYNPLSWPVTMAVRLPVGHERRVVIHPSGEEVKSEIIPIPESVLQIPSRQSNSDHELVFIAKGVPALGYRSYFMKVERTEKREATESVTDKKERVVRQAEYTDTSSAETEQETNLSTIPHEEESLEISEEEDKSAVKNDDVNKKLDSPKAINDSMKQENGSVADKYVTKETEGNLKQTTRNVNNITTELNSTIAPTKGELGQNIDIEVVTKGDVGTVVNVNTVTKSLETGIITTFKPIEPLTWDELIKNSEDPHNYTTFKTDNRHLEEEISEVEAVKNEGTDLSTKLELTNSPEKHIEHTKHDVTSNKIRFETTSDIISVKEHSSEALEEKYDRNIKENGFTEVNLPQSTLDVQDAVDTINETRMVSTDMPTTTDIEDSQSASSITLRTTVTSTVKISETTETRKINIENKTISSVKATESPIQTMKSVLVEQISPIYNNNNLTEDESDLENESIEKVEQIYRKYKDALKRLKVKNLKQSNYGSEKETSKEGDNLFGAHEQPESKPSSGTFHRVELAEVEVGAKEDDSQYSSNHTVDANINNTDIFESTGENEKIHTSVNENYVGDTYNIDEGFKNDSANNNVAEQSDNDAKIESDRTEKDGMVNSEIDNFEDPVHATKSHKEANQEDTARTADIYDDESLGTEVGEAHSKVKNHIQEDLHVDGKVPGKLKIYPQDADSKARDVDNYFDKSNLTEATINVMKAKALENMNGDYQNLGFQGRTPDIRKYDPTLYSDLHIKNQYIRINLDKDSRKVSSVVLSNGVQIMLDLQYYYYVSDEPLLMGRERERPPGAHIFRSLDNKPVPILDYVDTKVYKTGVVEEIHCVYSNFASFVVRLYPDSPIIEVDWLVGPVPIEDQNGKDVFIRYMTDLRNNGVFYTDSNGRQTVKRMRNLRPTFNPTNKDPVAGNYYPVTTKIYIEDLKRDLRFAVFNDRSQGGASLDDGEIDLMLHRRILTDDTPLGMGAGILNETENGKGTIIRGKHYLYLTTSKHKPNKIFEKKLAKEIELMPQVFVTKDAPYGEQTENIWLTHNNEYSFLNTKMPVGVHLLTLQPWDDNTILIRLENYLEKSDVLRTGVKTVFLKDLFVNVRVNRVKETMLAANVWLENHKPLKWRKRTPFVKSFNDFYASGKKVGLDGEEKQSVFKKVDLEKGIRLKPQEIRTFVCWVDYIS